MSTKITLVREGFYHLYVNCNDLDLMFLEIDDPNMTFRAEPDCVVVSIDIDAWDMIRSVSAAEVRKIVGEEPEEG